MLLLDTHVWIWLVKGENRAGGPGFLRKIRKASETSSIRISVISVWEVAMLESKGRIQFPVSCQEWVRRALNSPGIRLAQMTPEIAIESSRLPGNLHKDPADRILIATAQSLGATLVTDDKRILSYAKHHPLMTLALR